MYRNMYVPRLARHTKVLNGIPKDWKEVSLGIGKKNLPTLKRHD